MVRQYKGAYSGEHGDGLCRGEWVAWQFGPRLNAAFAEIKALFDPDNRMNPGKIVAPPRMDDASLFRFGPRYRRDAFEPALDWSAWDVQRDPLTGRETEPGSGGDPSHGLANAIEMCNNNGHCRKFDAGTMCPSYRVTRDEQHTTRGRANTLRLALAGQLGRGRLRGRRRARRARSLRVVQGLPARVSDRRRHGEAQNRGSRRAQRAPRRRPAAKADRIPAALRATREPRAVARQSARPHSRRGAPFRALARLVATSLASAMGRAITCASAHPGSPRARRRPPMRSAKSCSSSIRSTTTSHVQTRAPPSACSKPAGYRVHIPVSDAAERGRCAAAARFSPPGMVAEARDEARRTLDALLPFARRGVAIVGLEPSCLLELARRVPHLSLRRGCAVLASNALLFEEFLVREKTAGRFSLELAALPNAEALLHGHCHQKAFAALDAVTTVLGWIPGLKTRVVESSCCGMAGAFGYEAKHYDVSMQMAELSLLPAIRDAAAETLIIADGFSCRHQIADGTGRDALHVARVLELALDGGKARPQ